VHLTLERGFKFDNGHISFLFLGVMEKTLLSIYWFNSCFLVVLVHVFSVTAPAKSQLLRVLSSDAMSTQQHILKIMKNGKEKMIKGYFFNQKVLLIT
jgi:hypothetical protein